MKKIAIDEAPAGPAMDAAVAKALGWEQKGAGAALSWRMPTGELRTREETSFRSFKPSTDIAAAWELIPTVFDYSWVLFRQGSTDCLWIVGDPIIVESDSGSQWVEIEATAKGETAPLAICRAFLKANRVEYVEVERTAENNAQVCGLNSVGRKASADHPWRGKRAKA